MGRAQKLPRIDEYKIGPEPDGIRMCVGCRDAIQPGQVWVKAWAPGLEYAVGWHVTCLVREGKHLGSLAAAYRECSLCGHLSKDEAEAALHFRFVHRISYGVALDALLS